MDIGYYIGKASELEDEAKLWRGRVEEEALKKETEVWELKALLTQVLESLVRKDLKLREVFLLERIKEVLN